MKIWPSQYRIALPIGSIHDLWACNVPRESILDDPVFVFVGLGIIIPKGYVFADGVLRRPLAQYLQPHNVAPGTILDVLAQHDLVTELSGIVIHPLGYAVARELRVAKTLTLRK